MTMKPHFMPKNPGANPWDPSGVRGVPVAPALTFSSKSPFSYDDWERQVARPYQVVVTPGYVPLARSVSLERDGDYAWFDRAVHKPTIIWDGFCPVALWEVIYDAFRQPVVGGKMYVRDVSGGGALGDRRSAALLLTRPARPESLPDPVEDPYGYGVAMRQYRKALMSWATSCAGLETGGYRAQVDWRTTAAMYAAVLAPKTEWHVDGARRSALAEAKWNRDHTRPIVERSDYQSPVQFMEVDISKRAHRVFARAALDSEAAAAARTRTFVQRPALEAPRPGFWGRLFGA